MKFLSLAALFATLISLAPPATSSEGVPAAVHYVGHDTVSATMEKGGPIVSDPGLIILAQRRGAGPAEYHEHTSHVFIMVDGEATLVVGGTMVDPTQTAPNEMRAERIDGGEIHHMTKGDVITIPAKTPHWWKDVPTKTIAYYAVNIESQ